MRWLAVLLCGVVLLSTGQSFAQAVHSREEFSRLQMLADRYRQEMDLRQQETDRLAVQRGYVVRQILSDGGLVRIRRVEEGCPFYYITHNLNAAQTVSTDLLWSDGLLGSGISIGLWDGGDVLLSHQEFGGRVVDADGASGATALWHPTAVAATMVAAGMQAAAKGMAPQAQIDAYDWDSDIAEMLNAAADPGILLSNHSYGTVAGWSYGAYDQTFGQGWYWFGDIDIDDSESNFFGRYDSEAQSFDEIMAAAPHYLIVVAAGNDRYEGPTNQPVPHFALSSTARPGQYSWVASDVTRPLDGVMDCLAGFATAKNVLTVAAVNDIPDHYSAPGDVTVWGNITNRRGSSAGPTDDGRIKPDLAANGFELYTASEAGNALYSKGSGTSFSAPNATGSLALLQEHYYKTHGQTAMQGMTLKALAIHTADESGPAPGPDYEFGWGLLNSKKAADLIAADAEHRLLIREAELSTGETVTVQVCSPGSTPLRATLAWSDPPGTPASLHQIDAATPMLVNDLDLRILYEGQTFYPWTLDPNNPQNPANRDRDNAVDNVEQVVIDLPQSGCYTIQITHKGVLQDGLQTYGLILSGAITEFDFGDAPDETDQTDDYPTLSASNGAAHAVTADVFLGSHRDSETDGQPDPLALGDDNQGSQDDEDGILFMMPLVPGTLAGVQAIASVPGYLNAWFDWNRDGDWADDDEHVFIDRQLTGGINNLNLSVPASVEAGSLFARFRFSTVTGLSYTGTAPDGEVEDYLVAIQPDSDGDGIPDAIEGNGDRDGDGVIDALDYDPTGYFYDELSGAILSGGQVAIEGPQDAVVLLLHDGSNGYYQFQTDGTPGIYTLQITPPPGFILNTSCAQMTPLPFDPTGSTNPVVLGSAEIGNTGYLGELQCSGNPYSMVFDLQPGDPWIINNNIPFSQLIAIELSSFVAEQVAGDVLLSWETQSETENLGFHLYRRHAADQEYTRLTDEMIPGAGNSQATRRYTFVDSQIEVGQTYLYQLEDIDYNGISSRHQVIEITVAAPQAFALQQNYPNPFNPETTIRFDLDSEGWCELSIYNLFGQRLRRLVEEYRSAGSHVVVWDGRDDRGAMAASGVYIYRLEHNSRQITRKMHLLR